MNWTSQKLHNDLIIYVTCIVSYNMSNGAHDED